MSWRRTGALVFATGVLYLVAMLISTGGRPSLPLDDSFIYFQYAKQAAAGQPLVYHPGDAPTTGATSLPWMLVLSLGALLGFHGKAMVFFAMGLAGLAFVVAVHAAGRAQRALAPRKPGSERPGDLGLFGLPLAAALVWCSGPLQWGTWSGMEIALFAAAITVSYAAFVRGGSDPSPGAAAALAWLAVARPEGALLAGAAVFVWILRALAPDPDGPRAASRRLAWMVLPLAAACLVPLVAYVATGEPRSTGYLAKSMLALPGAELLDTLRVAAVRALSLGAALFGGLAPLADGVGLYAYESETAAWFVAPGAGLLFLIGVLPAVSREWADRRPGPGLLALVWIVGLVFATCLLEEPDAHFSCYQMPILPIFLIWVAMGVGRLARVTRDGLAGLPRLELGLRIWLLGFGAVSVFVFAGAFGDAARDIDRMQITFGESLRERLEPGETVAINDAGAIAYFSGRRTLDLVGLTTPGFAGLWSEGTGALWEGLEALPADRRPGWFCIFPNWFEFGDLGILARVGSVRLLRPSIVDAEKVLYRADWSLAGSGDRPRLPGEAAPIVLDAIDVADRGSEAAHDFTYRDGEPGGSGGTFARRAGFAHEPSEILDGARTVMREVTFRVTRDPLRATRLVARSVTGVRQRLLVSVDGEAPVPVELYAPGAGRFHDQVLVPLPPGADPAEVRISVTEGAAASAPLILAHVFVVGAG